VVVADWRLPDGDGIELADWAARLGAKTVIVSGYLFALPPASTARHEVIMKPVRARRTGGCHPARHRFGKRSMSDEELDDH
jgi:hypothetical protein